MIDFSRCTDAAIKQQLRYLELENYTFDTIVRYLQNVLEPKTKQDHYNLLKLAELFWERVGKGTTTLEEVPIVAWMLKV